MEKDLKGLISKTDYLIYMLLGLLVQIITGKIGFIYFPYIWYIFSVKDSSRSEPERLFK